MSRKSQESAAPSYEFQSRVLPGSENIHVSVLTNGNEQIEKPPDSDVTTLLENLQRAVRLWPDGEFLGERAPGGRRRYGWLRYQEVLNRAQRIGSALIQMGIEPGSETKIGICGNTCSEWVIAQYGAMAYSMVVVPVYHSYHRDALTHIINTCQLEVLFCDTKDRISSFLDNASETPSLKFLIQMQPPFGSKADAETNGI